MNDAAISFFLSLARTGSYTATANQMLTTKQFVSKTIQTMEKELGFPLFIRDSHTVVLTSEGRQMADFFHDCDSRYCVANSANRLFAAQRYIWIAVEEWVGLFPELAKLFNQFERENNCTIRLKQTADGKAMGLVLAGDADAAITSRYCAGLLDSVCCTTALYERGLCLTIAADHPLATQLETSALQTIPFLTVFAGEHSPLEVYERINRELPGHGGAHPDIRIKHSLAAVFAEVLLGNGVTALPRREVSKEMLQVPLRRTVTTAFSRLRSPRIAAVLELEAFLKQAMGGADG